VQKPVIVVHGGAGAWPKERSQAGYEGVKAAAKTGYDCLASGGSALDAVEAAVKSMEDSSAFNAGLGSAFTIDKKIQMEASIMDGKTLRAGATGLLKDIKNPISLARITMEKTDHIFIVGEGAEKLANLYKLPRRNPMTETRLNSWRELTAKLKNGEVENLPKLRKLITKYPDLFEMDTVGAVALDREGNTAAATSTGGFTLKLPGRIGDSPLIGSGNYADNQAGACSATGIGEIAIRLVLAKHVIDQMRSRKSAQKAVENAVLLVNQRIGTKNSMGLIAVDTQGRIGAAHNTQNIAWAYMTPKMKEPKADLKAKQILVEPDKATE
jgi:beta-aspartyl-peptidase (threonine type)